MRIYVVNSYDEMSKQAANIVASQVTLKPNSVLGLATGGTPVGMYKQLVEMYQKGDVDFKQVTTFNLDEYYPLSRENANSYYHYMYTNLFKHINVPGDHINIPNGMAKDVIVECQTYEKNIESAGGIDLQVLGIGPNGHIGFNEPDVKFEAGTHLVKLDEHTIEANARFFDSKEEVPTEAISMGIRTIMRAKKIILLANGESKAKVIKEMVSGDISPKVPASILQLHGDVTVIVDQEAAKELKNCSQFALCM
ncbi:glucosamine-6-phosphate deaminase [Vallitalea okinawensis]|uniref:glucosamine-6-phosphate deaminase n=1 Tax=Vallitalea okinawensis TaxID=2078660 RepID=UPI000CFCEC66